MKRTLKKGLKVFEIVKRERHKIIKNRFFTLFHSILIFIYFFFILKKKNIKILMYLKKMTYYQYGIKMEQNFFFKKSYKNIFFIIFLILYF